jgi:hypothetical protein
MPLHYVLVEIGGDPDQAMDLIRSLPGGEYLPQDEGNGRYLVATTNAGFLKFAFENQGYGKIISDDEVVRLPGEVTP